MAVEADTSATFTPPATPPVTAAAAMSATSKCAATSEEEHAVSTAMDGPARPNVYDRRPAATLWPLLIANWAPTTGSDITCPHQQRHFPGERIPKKRERLLGASTFFLAMRTMPGCDATFRVDEIKDVVIKWSRTTESRTKSICARPRYIHAPHALAAACVYGFMGLWGLM
eukprot:1066447-Prorocentrum_minimum.AAC.2